jgi:hypothetical protein
VSQKRTMLTVAAVGLVLLAVTVGSATPPGLPVDLVVTFDPDFHHIEGQVLRLVWFARNNPT